MKCKIKLIIIIYLLSLSFIDVKSHGPWKYYYPYAVPAYPPIPRYPGFGQPRPTNICMECINKFSNFARFFNFPGFSQFGNQNGNTGSTKSPNLRTINPAPLIEIESFSTIPPPITNSPPTPFTFIPQTVRPPIPRRSTVRPAVVQPDPNPSMRIGIDENQEFISTEDRIRAILKTTNAPVTHQPYYTYPGIKNSLNHMNYQLADIKEPYLDGLHLLYPSGH